MSFTRVTFFSKERVGNGDDFVHGGHQVEAQQVSWIRLVNLVVVVHRDRVETNHRVQFMQVSYVELAWETTKSKGSDWIRACEPGAVYPFHVFNRAADNFRKHPVMATG
eukprot:SAG11_NODE_12940_length_678_cov_0.525043_1_plen_108_part_10